MHAERAAGVVEHRRAGIAGAGAEPRPLAFGGGIDQADLQRAGLAGRDQRRGAHRAAAAAVAGRREAVARDQEADRRPRPAAAAPPSGAGTNRAAAARRASAAPRPR